MPSLNISMEDFMRHIAEERSEQPPKRGIYEAQAIELRARMAPLLSHSHRFKPGDMVRSTHGLSMVDGEPELAMMFVRYILEDDFSDRALVEHVHETAHMPNVNCIVAFIPEDNHSVVMLPYEAQRLEIDTRA